MEAHESWLRRVSDYHSGGIDAAERAQVEAHLATCDECQNALAMYRRFYALARSPLALGAPEADMAERPAVRSFAAISATHPSDAARAGRATDVVRARSRGIGGGIGRGAADRELRGVALARASVVPASRQRPHLA